MSERIKSYTAHCKAAAQRLFWLLREIEECTTIEAARVIARERHLWCVEADPVVDAVEPITPSVHRQWLRSPHPLAIASGSEEARRDDAFVGDYDPASYLRQPLPTFEPIHIVFTEQAGTDLVFVEVERPLGISVDVGSWSEDARGYKVLTIPADPPQDPAWLLERAPDAVVEEAARNVK